MAYPLEQGCIDQRSLAVACALKAADQRGRAYA